VNELIHMDMATAKRSAPKPAGSPRPACFNLPRDFLDNRFVYLTISPRARGLSVGLDFNPDGFCNFDCVYCEVNRVAGMRDRKLDVAVMSEELERTLHMVSAGELCERPQYRSLPAELLTLRHVALSGDGEPTLCPEFAAAVEAVIRVRARGRFPFFKLVLITNSSGLDRPEVTEGLRLFHAQDEVWAKLDAGTEPYFQRINKSQCKLEQVLANILALARQRPVIIQSLFPVVHECGPTPDEVDAYVLRLLDLKEAGAQIPLVQIYSATRPMMRPECGHLRLNILSAIAQRVRTETGLKAEVF
jgi:wyosine [tRNA(Phe)-imidazoG37] synthetase (radical SAM superfamily)